MNVEGLVVPYVGTWIEINPILSVNSGAGTSFPTWERG